MMLKRMICKFNLVIFNFKAKGFMMIHLNEVGSMRSMQCQLGVLETISAFA
jgi:hypothetical protein